MQSDTEYLRARIEQEQNAAACSTEKIVRLRHLELAAAYAFRLREINAEQRKGAVHLVPTGSFGGLVAAMEEEAVGPTTAA